MKMYIGAKWVEGRRSAPVMNPFDQSVIDTVPRATAAEVGTAIASAVRGAKPMGAMPAYQRYAILRRAADLISQRAEHLARTITLVCREYTYSTTPEESKTR